MLDVFIDYDPDGRRFVATGRDCYDCRELLKAAGCRWDPKAKKWWRSEPPAGWTLTGRAQRAVDAAAQARVETKRLSSAADADVSIDIPLPDGLELHPFQRVGVQFLATHDSALVGDEMGLGKTVQVIGAMNVVQPRSTLIVAPLSLTYNWRNEAAKWSTLDLSVGVANAKQWPETDVVIIHPDILVKHQFELHRHWGLIVVDECHFFKNGKTQRSKALFDRGVQADRKWALSGTPIPSRPVELQKVLHWLQPDCSEWSWWHYTSTYCGAYEDRFGRHCDGASQLARLQDELRSRVMIRRLKRDVLSELPPKVRQLVVLDPSSVTGAKAALAAEQRAEKAAEKEQAAAKKALETAKPGTQEYDAAVRRLTRPEIEFESMSTVRHNSALVKAPAVAAHVRNLLDGGIPKIVVWAHHHDVIDLLVDELGQFGVVSITGETSQADRQSAVEAFQAADDARVFVGSITAAGTGITLTAASVAVFAELDWVPGNITQAEDRIHRIGQDADSVLVQHVVLDGSIDARLASTLVAKQAVADKALDRAA